MRQRRTDFSRVANITRTPQGGLRVEAFLTRVGVFSYDVGTDKPRRELRHPDEVFSPDSLASLRGAVVTDLHPSDGPVTPENYRKLTVGHVAEDVQANGTKVAAHLWIQAADAIRQVDAGERKELSCGYDCTLEMVSGVYDGEPYDAIQRGIRYNHVALLPVGAGRAGRDCALRIDATDAFQIRNDDDKRDEDTTMKITIDGKEYDLSTPEGKKALADLQAKASKVDALEKQVRDAARSKLVDQVRLALKIKGRKLDDAGEASIESGTATDIELMTMLCEVVLGDMFDSENKDEAYIRGCFAAAVKGLAKQGPATETEIVEPTDAPAPGGGSDLPLDSASAKRKPLYIVPLDKPKTPVHADAAGIVDGDAAREDMIKANRERAAVPPRKR